jgi:hypothetical protein
VGVGVGLAVDGRAGVFLGFFAALPLTLRFLLGIGQASRGLITPPQHLPLESNRSVVIARRVDGNRELKAKLIYLMSIVSFYMNIFCY